MNAIIALLCLVGLAAAMPMLLYVPPLRFYLTGTGQNVSSICLCANTTCLNKTFTTFSPNIFDLTDDPHTPANWTRAKAVVDGKEIKFDRSRA